MTGDDQRLDLSGESPIPPEAGEPGAADSPAAVAPIVVRIQPKFYPVSEDKLERLRSAAESPNIGLLGIFVGVAANAVVAL